MKKIDIISEIHNKDISEIELDNLFDAHRHGLFAENEKFSLRGIKVDKWVENENFINYEKEISSLNEKELISKLGYWCDFSVREGVSTIIDISGKKYNKAVNEYYKSKGIKHLLSQHWSKWEESQNDVELLIISDESELSESVIDTVKDFYSKTNGKLMIHVLESFERKEYFFNKYNMSTVAWLEKNNLLNERTYLVHMNVASKEDFEIVKQKNSHIVLCPSMRLSLSNPEPNLISDLNLHFGTDGPIATGEYSILKQGVLQYNIWKRTMDEDFAAKLVIKSLFSSPYKGKRKIKFFDNNNILNNENKFIEIMKSFNKIGQLEYKVINEDV